MPEDRAAEYPFDDVDDSTSEEGDTVDDDDNHRSDMPPPADEDVSLGGHNIRKNGLRGVIGDVRKAGSDSTLLETSAGWRSRPAGKPLGEDFGGDLRGDAGAGDVVAGLQASGGTRLTCCALKHDVQYVLYFTRQEV